MNEKRIERLFSREALPVVSPQCELQVEEVRQISHRLADAILEHSPSCPDRSDAIRKVREAMQTAVQAIIFKP